MGMNLATTIAQTQIENTCEIELLYTCRLGETGRADYESETRKTKTKLFCAHFFVVVNLPCVPYHLDKFIWCIFVSLSAS